MAVTTETGTVLDAGVVDEYLARVGHPGGPPTLETLSGLTRAHVETIPFENVDVVLSRHRGIGLDAVVDKLVRRRRGGYCYEHAGLLAAVLEHLGFVVRPAVARVQPDQGGPNTHEALIVTLEGQDHLADVGFGAGMLLPVPLRDGVEVDQAGWTNRLERDGRCWTLIQRDAGGENRAYRLDPDPTAPVDFEVFHHYTSTHPASPFTGQLVVMRLTDGLSRRLVRTTLTHEHADGRVERREVTAATVVDELAGLDVDLDDEEAAALRARWDEARGDPSRA